MLEEMREVINGKSSFNNFMCFQIFSNSEIFSDCLCIPFKTKELKVEHCEQSLLQCKKDISLSFMLVSKHWNQSKIYVSQIVKILFGFALKWGVDNQKVLHFWGRKIYFLSFFSIHFYSERYFECYQGLKDRFNWKSLVPYRGSVTVNGVWVWLMGFNSQFRMTGKSHDVRICWVYHFYQLTECSHETL